MGGAMQRLFTLCSFILISLFLLSADKFSCQPNAKLDRTSANSYLEYYPSGSSTLIRTYTPGYPDGINEYLITTDTYGNKYIKNASLPLSYDNIQNSNDIGRYSVVNIHYLDYFIDNGIYTLDDDDPAEIEKAKAILPEWIGNPPKPQSGDFFPEPVFIYVEDADYDVNPNDHYYEYPKAITKAFYAKKTDVNGNGSRLIIETFNALDVYDYAEVLELQDAAQPINKIINVKNTVDIKKNIPNKLQ